MPVEAFEVRLEDCPAIMVVGEADTVGATNAELMIAVSPVEHTEEGEYAESVTI